MQPMDSHSRNAMSTDGSAQLLFAGQPLAHDSAALHVTGWADYTDDMAPLLGEAHAAVVASECAHARINSIDSESASRVPGVLCVLSADDVPGEIDIGHIATGDPVLASGIVEHFAQPLALVVAEDELVARRAVGLVSVDYQLLEPILDVTTALERGSYVADPLILERGDPGAAITEAAHQLSGELNIGGQEHFYLEGQVARAIPQDDGAMVVHASTQSPTETQRVVAAVLGVPMRSVTIEVRRMGGGFGGKETQASRWACLAAIGAQRIGRPVRLRLPRAHDMAMTGKRHPFNAAYRVGFDSGGLIIGLELDLVADCGHSNDLSEAVVEIAALGAESCYFLPSARIRGYACKTNKVSNTAFRGFGNPQSTLVIETILERIAQSLGMDPVDVRRANFYSSPHRAETIYRQPANKSVAPELVADLEKSSQYRQRRRDIREFNQTSRILKRGIALTPAKMGISLTKPLYQAGALLHIYYDGSIHLNHGGTEMGQGLYIKCAQLVAEELQVDLDRIQLSAARTDKVPNTSATAGSTGTDVNGMAVLNAARKLRQRLTEFAASEWNVELGDITFENGRITAANQQVTFEDLVRLAYQARVQLSATGFYKGPEVWFDRKEGIGQPFFYFAYGAGCSEVVVDTLTGECRILRVDLLQDVGRSLNPAVDIGQVEGAFTQGLGWLTCEELVWDRAGRLLTAGPSTYKIPAIGDTPVVFNTKLAPNLANNRETVFRSKAVGEPPLMTAISVFEAIRDAIAAVADYRVDVELDAPATPERVLSALEQLRVNQAASELDSRTPVLVG